MLTYEWKYYNKISADDIGLDGDKIRKVDCRVTVTDSETDKSVVVNYRHNSFTGIDSSTSDADLLDTARTSITEESMNNLETQATSLLEAA